MKASKNVELNYDSNNSGRFRLFGSGDGESSLLALSSLSAIDESKSEPDFVNDLFSDNVYLSSPYHNEYFAEVPVSFDSFGLGKDLSWRLTEKLKTSGAALVVCLNIGTDPPDVFKPNPCSRRQCWIEPVLPKHKGIVDIGNALQCQYEKLQPKIKYKPCLDPTIEELRKVCTNLRKNAGKSDRLLFHYNGHGVPKPTKNGEIWVFGKHYTQYDPISIHEIRNWIKDPAIYVFDCAAAGLLVSHIIDCDQILKQESSLSLRDMGRNGISFDSDRKPRSLSPSQLARIVNTACQKDGIPIVLAACKASESLPTNPQYPADIFTCCLTTPIAIALRWLILQYPYSLGDISLDLSENLPGKEGDRKTPRGELNWIFTAITDTIAWSSLPPSTFQKIFRQDLLVSSLFRNFLLAKRIMKTFNCTPQSWPILPDTSCHPLWQSWDLAAESCLLHVSAMIKGSPMVDPKNNIRLPPPNIPPPNLPFFTEQLSAFEIWLEFAGKNGEIPTLLPILLQVLLSPTHRLKALLLLKRYLSLGPAAVYSTLFVGISPYILKLLQSPASDVRQILVCIWAFIVGFDPSCRNDLIRDKSQSCFIQYMNARELSPAHRCLATFVLAEICNKHPEGQQTCLQQGLHRSCVAILSQPEVMASSSLKQWACLCVAKLMEDFIWAKYLCITESLNNQIYPLLTDRDPLIRASAALTLGEFFGASNVSNLQQHQGGYGDLVDQRELRESELKLALQLLESCTDGCIKVRRESIVALSKFIILHAHLPCFLIITRILIKSNVKFLYSTQTQELNSSPLSNVNFPSAAPSSSNMAGLVAGSNRTTAQGGGGPAGGQKDERGNTPPTPTSTSVPVKSDFIWPWNLTDSQTQSIVDDVRIYLESQGIGRTPPSSPMRSGIDDGTNGTAAGGASSYVDPTSGVDIANTMAAAYVKFWLAICELQGKDPSLSIVLALSAIFKRIQEEIVIDDSRQALALKSLEAADDIMIRLKITGEDDDFDDSMDSPSESIGYSFADTLSPLAANTTAGAGANTGYLNYPSSDMYNAPLMSPMGHHHPAATSAGRMSPRSGNLHLNKSRRPTFHDRPSQFPVTSLSTTDLPSAAYSSSNFANISHSSDSSQTTGGGSMPPRLGFSSGSNLDLFKMQALQQQQQQQSQDNVPQTQMILESEPILVSYFYDWTKRLFLMPDDGYDICEDVLSIEGNNRLYREEKLHEVRETIFKLTDLYKALDDSADYSAVDRKTKEENQMVRAANIAAMPPSLIKFEQKTILNMDNSKITSIVKFHSFQDILATCDGHSIKLWSSSPGYKRVEIKNTHNYLGSLAHNSYSSTEFTGSSGNSRITAMEWINEGYDSLLMVGSDNGVVNVWRDISESDITASSAAAGEKLSITSGHHNMASNPNLAFTLQNNQNIAGTGTAYSSLYSSSQNSTLSAVSSFIAQPDIADTSRGSGLILSWIQESGVVVTGGNSTTIRIWDVGREQCVRVFSTGIDTPTTALAAKPVSSSFFASLSPNDPSILKQSVNPNLISNFTWTFAGFADGTVAIFDERSNSSSGKVQSARADTGSWIVNAYCRHDLPQVITAAFKGTVRFWDVRTMRVYKTLEVFKHPLTALAVHRCLPVMATGSHAQIIKIFTMGGDQLGNDIKYHDGFLGQRIGPLSCLAFHPLKLMLAAGATDNIVSLYAPPEA